MRRVFGLVFMLILIFGIKVSASSVTEQTWHFQSDEFAAVPNGVISSNTTINGILQ